MAYLQDEASKHGLYKYSLSTDDQSPLKFLGDKEVMLSSQALVALYQERVGKRAEFQVVGIFEEWFEFEIPEETPVLELNAFLRGIEERTGLSIANWYLGYRQNIVG
jgi:hypothetical protein